MAIGFTHRLPTVNFVILSLAVEDKASYIPVFDDVQLTPESSECTQLWFKVNGQSVSLSSLPVHLTSSITIGPAPAPKCA